MYSTKYDLSGVYFVGNLKPVNKSIYKFFND